MKIYLVSKTVLNSPLVEQFIEDENTKWRRDDSASSNEEIVELSGRVCYMSFGESQSPRNNEEYIRNLIKMGHESVLEHACWTFIVTGVTRAFTHQLVRHRVGFSYSQLSQQYHDESEAKFIPPIELNRKSKAYSNWKEQARFSLDNYKETIAKMFNGRKLSDIDKEERRQIRSVARSILPNCIETKIAVTANARAIRHFLKIRGVIEGDLEMRYFSSKLLNIFKKDSPHLFQDIHVIEKHFDGHPILRVEE